MKQFLVLAAIVAVVAAGGSGDVDEALLARVAQILGANGGGSSGGSFGGSFGGGAIPAARSFAAPSSSYGAPNDDAIAIGRSGGRSSGGGVQIGSPERAQRVAEFDLSSGGASAGGFGRSALSSSYGAPGSNDAITIGRSAGRSSGGGLQIGRPERAQQVAAFELNGGRNAGGSFRSGGGYQ